MLNPNVRYPNAEDGHVTHRRNSLAAQDLFEPFDTGPFDWRNTITYGVWPLFSVVPEVIQVPIARGNDWLPAITERLNELLALPANWDSYGSRTISVPAATTALQLLRSVLSAGKPIPSIIPTSYGGIQIEWHRNNADLEISVFPDGKVLAYFEDESDNPPQQADLARSPDRLMSFLERVLT